MMPRWLVAVAMVACSSGTGDPCTSDMDGVIGGDYTFDLTIDDATFAPLILKTQNAANVALTLKNAGTTAHDFSIDCIPTPNDNGCPTTSCFPDGSKIAPLAPGASVTTTFITPAVEGIYTFRSDLAGDTQTGQFVVQ